MLQTTKNQLDKKSTMISIILDYCEKHNIAGNYKHSSCFSLAKIRNGYINALQVGYAENYHLIIGTNDIVSGAITKPHELKKFLELLNNNDTVTYNQTKANSVVTDYLLKIKEKD